jgi:hypothetical protein
MYLLTTGDATVTPRTRLRKYADAQAKKPPGERLSIYVPTALANELRQEAAAQDLPLSQYVVRILQGAV